MKQVKWIDVDKEEPVYLQFILYISQEDIDRYHYDEEKSQYWNYDLGVDTGIYWKEGLVEDGYDVPMTKIKYWSPAPRFEWDGY